MVNDVLDAVSARIKAPWFGYSILAFIGLNWRGIFLLTTTEGAPHMRLAAFDAVTSQWSLVVFPLLAGLFVALTAPWIRFAFGFASRRPFELIDNIHLMAEHKRTLLKTELEQSRAAFFAAKEEEIIERAKRDEQVDDISSDEIRFRVKTELDEIRRQRESASHGFGLPTVVARLSDEEARMLKAAARNESGSIKKINDMEGGHIEVDGIAYGNESERDFARYERVLEGLVSKGLVRKAGQGTGAVLYVLTDEGWQRAEHV